LAWSSLLVLAISQASTFPFRTVPHRLANARQLFAAHRASRIDPTAYWFDPEYARFLEAVRQRTPETATVALIAPKKLELYIYTAAYALAPRRVVGEAEEGSASFVAIYGAAQRPGPLDGKAIPGGTLARR
jgi:hypothetical protein